MLTFFPIPYPDELLYSIIARYHVWSGNYAMSETMEQLFDCRHQIATLLIPKHLQRLAEKTRNFGLDYETLLYEHTIFPLVSCFLEKSSFDKILDTVNKNDRKEEFFSIYNNKLIPRYIRYCPLCTREDRENFGEAYWHRKHQLYGIEMCYKHRCRLMDSVIELGNRNKRYTALELLNSKTDTLEKEDISDCIIEMQISYDVDFIYNNYEFVSKLIHEKHSLIREATIAILCRRDLATKKGFVRISKLKQEFQDRYANTYLKQLVADLNGYQNWLITLCRGGQTTVVPIRFILFADFIAGSFESFMKIINEQEQFIDRTKEVFQQPIGYEGKLVLYRMRWLDVWEKNPNGSRSDLARNDIAAYHWLRRYDYEWFLHNLPQVKNAYGIVVKDWVKIDNELESMVDDVVYYIKNLVGKPERITKTNIVRYMRQKRMVERNYRMLPRTMYKIEQYLESTRDFQLRRIEWVKSVLIKEGKPVTPWIILRNAGIAGSDWKEIRQLFNS